MIHRGHALDLLAQHAPRPALVVTDPPYAFSGSGDEHALSATVATTLREVAQLMEPGAWMLVFAASSWRSTFYMAEAVRGILTPVRTAPWCKPKARTKARAAGWLWATVNVLALRKGKSAALPSGTHLDHICEPPLQNGRRAQVPTCVAEWAIAPFVQPGKLFLDPFAGSGVFLDVAAAHGMYTLGFELQES